MNFIIFLCVILKLFSHSVLPLLAPMPLPTGLFTQTDRV